LVRHYTDYSWRLIGPTFATPALKNVHLVIRLMMRKKGKTMVFLVGGSIRSIEEAISVLNIDFSIGKLAKK
jgi:hypothetical protein